MELKSRTEIMRMLNLDEAKDWTYFVKHTGIRPVSHGKYSMEAIRKAEKLWYVKTRVPRRKWTKK